MEHVNNTLLDTDGPKVTGRKAAISLRLFRGDGWPLDPLVDLDGLDDLVPTTSHETATATARELASIMTTTSTKNITLPGAKAVLGDGQASIPASDGDINDSRRSLLEPVSLATYFPHTPIKDDLSPKVNDSEDTATLQHLMADLEFDHGSHGDITKIKMHKQDDVVPENDRLSLPQQFTNVNSAANEAYPLTVELRPFKNKVGGHTAIFRFSKKAVCKALMNRENLWYEAVERKHLDLIKFMPKYIGVLNVRYSSLVSEDAMSPNLGPAAEPLDAKLAARRRPSLPEYHKSNRRVRLADDGLPPEVSLDDNRHIIPDLLWKQYSNSAPNSSALDEFAGSPAMNLTDLLPENAEYDDFSIGSTSVNTDLQAQVIQEVFVPQRRKSDDIFNMDDEEGVRDSNGDDSNEPERVHDDFNTTRAAHVLRKHTRFERYILLEDLTADMQKPCALDLKMGTRQYGVEANEIKQASQRKKCLQTTSRELGVRVCGLQAWDEKRQRYFMRDKYFGRRLKSGMQFAKILAKFLYDGSSEYSVVAKIPSIIKQLKELYGAFEKLNGYRMYGSSVLLMYDGANQSVDTKVSVHIIDFAQSVIGEDATNTHYSRPPKYPELPDMGYLRGLKTLIRYYKDIFHIITGQDYDSVENVSQYLEEYKEQLNKACYWIGAFAEDDDGVVREDLEALKSTQGVDPFDKHYVSNNDETGISD